jgi:hypothetical protein
MTSVKGALSAARKRAVEDGTAVFCLGSLYTYSTVTDAIHEIEDEEKTQNN